MYWKTSFWKALGKRKEKDVEEFSTISTFLQVYNEKQNEKFRVKTKGERPDFVCENEKGELIAVELKELADDGPTRKKNLKIVSQNSLPNGRLPIEGLQQIKRRVYYIDDVLEILSRIDEKSFELLRYNVKFKFALLDISDSFLPEETLENLRSNPLDLTNFKNLDAVFILYYKAGMPGHWEYVDFWQRRTDERVRHRG